MTMRRTATLVLALLAEGAVVSAAEDVRAAIEAVDKAFCAAMDRSDAAAIAALYTSIAEVLPPGIEAVRGREAIRKIFQAGMDAGQKELTLTTVEVEAHGDTAHEVGTWTAKGKDGTILDSGKYVVIWKYEGGRWRLHRHIWNSNTPSGGE
jgi:ketosteroid isomerase-like protein